jgi:hypothetical protein
MINLLIFSSMMISPVIFAAETPNYVSKQNYKQENPMHFFVILVIWISTSHANWRRDSNIAKLSGKDETDILKRKTVHRCQSS